MNLSRFRELARAYGSDLARWPEAERDAARALSEASEAARATLGEERSLDAVFAAFEPPRLSDTLSARLARLPDKAVARPLPLPRRAWRAPAVGWAAAALFGLWLGTQSAEAEDASDATASAESLVSDTPDALSSAEDSTDLRVAELASGALEGWEDFE